MVLFKMRTSMSANIADLIWYIIFVSSTPFILLFFPYIIPWYEGGFLMPEMLMVLPVTVGTAPWGVSRTLAYCAVSPSFGRCLGYPRHCRHCTLGCILYSRLLCRFSLLRPLSRVPGTQSIRPSSSNGPRPFRHLQLSYLTEKETYGV